MGRATTSAYRQSMHAQVRKVTNPSITLTYTSASNYYFNNTKIISLKRTQTVDILGRSVPTESLTWVARMPSDYAIANPSGTYAAVRTGATAMINFLQVLQDGTYTYGCGTSSNYMDTYVITSITKDDKTGLYSFTAKSKLTIMNGVYKSESIRYQIVYLLGEIMTAAGGTYEHDITSQDDGAFTTPADGIEYKTALQMIAAATGRALYTFNNKIYLKQWDLTADPTTYISRKDYMQDGLEKSKTDALKKLTINQMDRKESDTNPAWTSATRPKAIAYRDLGTIAGMTSKTFTLEYDGTKEFDVTHATSAIANLEEGFSVDTTITPTYGIYNITVSIYNSNTAASDTPITVYGKEPTYYKSSRVYTTGASQGQEISVGNNRWLSTFLGSALQSRYATIYGYTTQYKVKYRGLQEVYCGDIIGIEDEEGVWQKAVVTSAILSYDGTLSGELTCIALGPVSTYYPKLVKNSSREICDVNGSRLVPADLTYYATSYTSTEIDSFITQMIGE